jgi:hypothetical protein
MKGQLVIAEARGLVIPHVVLYSLCLKLHPRRFPHASPFMHAIIGYMLGESYTKPEILELRRNDNNLLVRRTGDVGFNGIESWADFDRNWHNLIKVADLTADEMYVACMLFNTIPGHEGVGKLYQVDQDIVNEVNAFIGKRFANSDGNYSAIQRAVDAFHGEGALILSFRWAMAKLNLHK